MLGRPAEPMLRHLAGLALLALLAAGCSAGGLETPTETLERDQEFESRFGHVLADPPDGYTLCAITVPSPFSLSSEPDASLEVYGDTSLDDPYGGALYGVASFEAGPLSALPLGDTEDVDIDGNPGRLGRADGLLVADLTMASGRVLTYRAGNRRTIQLVARADEDVDLVELARSVRPSEDSAEIDASALPANFGRLGDLYELEGRAQFRFALDYQRRADDDALVDQVTLLGSAGSFEAMQAFRFRASTSAVVDVGGYPGVSADIGPEGQSRNVVSWIIDDQLILRIFSLAIPRDQLLELARESVRVDGEVWSALKAEFELAQCTF